MALKPETLNHCHVVDERGYLFHSEDTQSTEDEYLHLLHALVYSLKPNHILETGSYRGIGTAFMAKALKRNGDLAPEVLEEYSYFGKITSVELEPAAAQYAFKMLETNKVDAFARIVISDSIEYLKVTNDRYDFAFFDSQLPLRVRELEICMDRGLLRPGSMWAMHDTSRLRTLSPGAPDPQTTILWQELESLKGVTFLEFPLSRGLVVGQVK